MGRGDHPQRTPLYGVLLWIGAYVLGTVVVLTVHVTWVRAMVFALVVVASVIGAALTFRDNS
ncbi:hypothetical protein G4X40_13770 [Rhodococcus sp. D2-41]|uniref:Uncharacterized protein n=1 Tax=Speluncibacter jeojiensis TaxID=2710754 RepID=A0A9X4M330_9ACTN|nr:hypothetical protein [Rhodococcus sp. D2-41]MDG3011219.1 hypothetical protein [Rhodococcus sp. D2-41]MDG3015929.1 hypothetical protein [Corynebacteriales bacterium D3-21]